MICNKNVDTNILHIYFIGRIIINKEDNIKYLIFFFNFNSIK